jgi:hypothetical protein
VSGALAPFAATTYGNAALLGAASNMVQYGATTLSDGCRLRGDELLTAGLLGLVGGAAGGPYSPPTSGFISGSVRQSAEASALVLRFH